MHAFEYFGGVPKIIIPDNLKSAIIKASFCDPIVNRSYGDLANHYGFQIDPCLPGTPEHKGKVESGVKYVKNNFIPLRTFSNFTDANIQIEGWNTNTASIRIHGTTRRQPIELFGLYEKQTLKLLPATRCEISFWKELKVYNDIHIQFDKAYYSVPYELKGEYVYARKTASQVAVFYENNIVAVHFPVSTGKRATKEEHYPPDAFKYMKYDTDYCMRQASFIGKSTLIIINHLLNNEPIRNLRAAQNIIRMKKKYGKGRLEAACKRAVCFRSYNYYGIKNILEKELDKQLYFFIEEQPKKLNDFYARDIKQFLTEVSKNGNINTSQN
jgi:hypothetical protein